MKSREKMKEKSKNKSPEARASGGYFSLCSSVTFLCLLTDFVFRLEFIDQFGQVTDLEIRRSGLESSYAARVRSASCSSVITTWRRFFSFFGIGFPCATRLKSCFAFVDSDKFSGFIHRLGTGDYASAVLYGLNGSTLRLALL
jgi:hypothetical protein